ncbi:trypsin-like peptidase domain-containing protein [Actinomadura sp. SCN-SB]|uniref:trypsin-like peptidase domain-containing protein n=1 Tax=Actinomadura sp. SCN-SB TaxID=3373092 RepID=UPI0037528531
MRFPPGEGIDPGQERAVPSLLWRLSDELAGLVARVLPSVVAICGSKDEAFGSGFLIDGDGHVVTNHHVVAGEDTLRVTLRGHPPRDAELLGSDAALEVGDVLLTIEGTEVEGRAALYDHLGRESIGKPLTLEALRDDAVVELTVTAMALDD